MLERLGLANPGKRIAHHALNQIERPDRNSALFTDPKPEVLNKLGMEHCQPRDLALPVPRYFFCSSPTSLRRVVTDFPLGFLDFARFIAVSKRSAFFGDRSKWRVSSSPDNSSAEMSATSWRPLRLMITMRRFSVTSSQSLARLARAAV